MWKSSWVTRHWQRRRKAAMQQCTLYCTVAGSEKVGEEKPQPKVLCYSCPNGAGTGW